MATLEKTDLLPYLSSVSECGRNLSQLNNQWDNVRLLCEMECPTQSKNILPEMAKIQKSFSGLQYDLVDALTTESLRKMEQKAIPKAQVAIDILIRNLYERTADIGFLATDGDVQRFACLKNPTDADREAIRKRLREYVAKYTVYNEVIILDRDFTVLANLDPENDITGKRINDPLLDETLQSDKSFVETFRLSSLQTLREKAHIFSCKICPENSDEPVGVICLCFRFANETEAIFQKLQPTKDGYVISIIDRNNEVIASSDPFQLPVGMEVEPVSDEENRIVYYNGLEYYAKTLPTKGYEGYFGLGLRGHVMVPLGLAFKGKASDTLEKIEPEIMTGLMNRADSFSPVLKKIISQTAKINRSLKSIVFNGQIVTRENSQDEEFTRLRPLLNYISRMGSGIGQIFETSVKDLFATVVSSSMRNSAFLASLSIDIMDRNLYERADDCRWWALNPSFRSILAKGNVSDAGRSRLTSILSYINSLYTIYSSLFLFDGTGKIVAVSRKEREGDIGKVLKAGWVQSVLANSDESKYFVSPFEKSEFYGGKFTYIYGASVTNPQDGKRTVGGIGIVFDSEFQFRSMLNDSLPDDGGMFALFTDRKGNIISSTRDDMPAGGRLTLPEHLFQTENGKKHSVVLEYEGSYYCVGVSCSSGYREYKTTDGYHNDVLAFVFDKLAECAAAEYADDSGLYVDQSAVRLNENEEHIKLVSFTIEGRLAALEQEAVLESVDSGKIVSLPDNDKLVRGAVVYRRQYVPVINTHRLFGNEQDVECSGHLLIARMSDGILAALEADDLNSVLEVNASDMRAMPHMGGGQSIVKGVVSFHNVPGKAMLVLDHETILDRLDPELLKIDLESIRELTEKTQAEKKE